MIRKTILTALLCGSAFVVPGAAYAQEAQPAQQAEQTEPDASDAAADAAIAEAAPVDDASAKIELLQAQVEALQEALAQVQASVTKVTPSWKGAPQLEDKEAGWSFKVRGRLQYDAGYVSNPEDAIVTRNLGFNSRARRIRLGVEGTIPGGFGYKAEADFANSTVGFGDVILTYAPSGKPFGVTIGNHETFNGLEQMSSSRFLSFTERAAFDDAFINTRRIGLSAGYVNTAGTLRANAGLFTAHTIDSSLDNDGWIGAGRIVYSPLMGANQLHFGLNYQHREFQSNNGSNASSTAGAPSERQLARYRARPFTQLTDQRFVDTQAFAAKSDDIIGVEAAGVFKSFHVVAEGQYLMANAYRPGDNFDFDDSLDGFLTSSGSTPSAYTPGGDPSFWGGYIEAGYYLTGETRGYKNGLWDRTKVLKPFSKGGWGGFQINGRADYLDLADSDLKVGCTNNFTPGSSACTPAANLAKGGKQLGLLASVVWLPEDYLRFYLQYSHARITGGPSASTVEPTTPSSDPIDERKYGVDVVAARAQIDF